MKSKLELPASDGPSSASILPAQIKNQDVIRLHYEDEDANASQHPRFIAADFAAGAGLAAIAWIVRLPEGREFNLTGAMSPAELQQAFDKDSANPYRDNLFFQKGVVASLYPLANRLICDQDANVADEGFARAKVQGIEVKMPLNNSAKTPGAIPHHLHGLIYGEAAQNVRVDVSKTSAKVAGEFTVGPELWAGRTHVTTTNEISANGISFHMRVKNIGDTPVPVAAGAHPYFSSPDDGEDAIKVFVPAKKTAVINNLSDVLPTGEIIALKDADPALDFTDSRGTDLFAKQIKGNSTASRLDNLWLEPQTNDQGFVYCEVMFPRSKFKMRMTGLTKNIIGIQGYAPQFTKGQKPFVALELVTNLPDPREELWQQTPTGVEILTPGEAVEYGYRVELLPL